MFGGFIERSLFRLLPVRSLPRDVSCGLVVDGKVK
jgi:hypothetical protein